MGPPIVVTVLMGWISICYIVGLTAPWAYLSYKNAKGGDLGITDTGKTIVPVSVQNMTCIGRKSDLFVWFGVCDGDTCTGFSDNNAWEALDFGNAEYSEYYKHAITSDFAGDSSNWRTVQSLLVFSMFIQALCMLVYVFGNSCIEDCVEGAMNYICLGLVLTGAASIAAVAISLKTYALGHQFYTDSGYFLQGWFVYSEFIHGCEGPQYIPGPGIVMHPLGAAVSLLLGIILPFQCWEIAVDEECDMLPAGELAQALRWRDEEEGDGGYDIQQ